VRFSFRGDSFEPEIEFEIVEPRDVRIHSLVPQFVRKVFIMAAQKLGVGGVVEGFRARLYSGLPLSAKADMDCLRA
jgi:hypothetical protein